VLSPGGNSGTSPPYPCLPSKHLHPVNLSEHPHPAVEMLVTTRLASSQAAWHHTPYECLGSFVAPQNMCQTRHQPLSNVTLLPYYPKFSLYFLLHCCLAFPSLRPLITWERAFYPLWVTMSSQSLKIFGPSPEQQRSAIWSTPPNLPTLHVSCSPSLHLYH